MTLRKAILSKLRSSLMIVSALILAAACGDSEADKKDAKPPVRALKTFVIALSKRKSSAATRASCNRRKFQRYPLKYPDDLRNST
ncbi:MAG: hypothetical protein ACR2OW_09730 [Methyloligellaceae bacterium]